MGVREGTTTNYNPTFVLLGGGYSAFNITSNKFIKMKTINVIGREVMGIKRISDKLPYSDTLLDGVTESKMKGQFYYRYKYNGVAFVVNVTDEFTEQYNSKKLYSVNLTEEDDKLSFEYATTIQQEIDFKNCEVELESITPENFKRVTTAQFEETV